MKVSLTKKDLIRLVRSLSPTDRMKHTDPYVTEYGYSNLSGNWRWHFEELSKLGDDELWDLYRKLKSYGNYQ